MKIEKGNAAIYILDNYAKIKTSIEDKKVADSLSIFKIVLDHINANRRNHSIDVMSIAAMEKAYEIKAENIDKHLMDMVPNTTCAIIYLNFTILYTTLDKDKIFVAGFRGNNNNSNVAFQFYIDKKSINMSITGNYDHDLLAAEASRIVLYHSLTNEFKRIPLNYSYDIGYVVKSSVSNHEINLFVLPEENPKIKGSESIRKRLMGRK